MRQGQGRGTHPAAAPSGRREPSDRSSPLSAWGLGRRREAGTGGASPQGLVGAAGLGAGRGGGARGHGASCSPKLSPYVRPPVHAPSPSLCMFAYSSCPFSGS